MAMTVRLDDRVLQALIRTTPEKAGRLVMAAATAINSDIVTSFGSGVSAPGEPPGVDTGTLWASMRAAPHESDRLKAYVLTGVEYAPHLEFGTERMAARPFFIPVLTRWQASEFTRFVRDFGLV